MKFRLVKEIEGETLAGYQRIPMKTGDVVDIPDKFMNKAMRNPDYELVRGDATDVQTVESPVVRKKTKRKAKKKAKRKSGRPRKDGNEG